MYIIRTSSLLPVLLGPILSPSFQLFHPPSIPIYCQLASLTETTMAPHEAGDGRNLVPGDVLLIEGQYL